jgi:hypothetical protein
VRGTDRDLASIPARRRRARTLCRCGRAADWTVRGPQCRSPSGWADCPRTSQVGRRRLVSSVPHCGRHDALRASDSPAGAQINSLPRPQRVPPVGIKVDLGGWSPVAFRLTADTADAQSGESGLLLRPGRSDHSASSSIARVQPMSSTECRRMLFKCSIALYMTAQLERAQRHLPS